MPDMPQQGGPAPSPAPGGGGAPAPQGQGGGGIADAIVQVDQVLGKIADAVSQNPQVGDDVKKGFQAALSAFRQASQALVKGDGDGGSQEPDGDEAGGASTPEQGASGAVPMSPATRG